MVVVAVGRNSVAESFGRTGTELGNMLGRRRGGTESVDSGAESTDLRLFGMDGPHEVEVAVGRWWLEV